MVTAYLNPNNNTVDCLGGQGVPHLFSVEYIFNHPVGVQNAGALGLSWGPARIREQRYMISLSG